MSSRLHYSLRARRVTAAVSCLSLLLTSGCATYTPLERNAALSLGEARIDLTERGTLELSTRIGAGAVSLDGRLQTATDTSLTVMLVQTRSRNGDTQQWSGEQVTVPLSWISGYRQRRSSPARTSLFVGALLAAVAVVGLVFNAGNSGSGGNGGGGVVPR
ncbi:MAG TPA: hypothetical protein VE861_13030 [Gemmatimonadaceae bacterium]|nr:hypothetical protein [Gemmatimonadaceae bacterium]